MRRCYCRYADVMEQTVFIIQAVALLGKDDVLKAQAAGVIRMCEREILDEAKQYGVVTTVAEDFYYEHGSDILDVVRSGLKDRIDGVTIELAGIPVRLSLDPEGDGWINIDSDYAEDDVLIAFVRQYCMDVFADVMRTII